MAPKTVEGGQIWLKCITGDLNMMIRDKNNIFERVENFHADLAWNYPDALFHQDCCPSQFYHKRQVNQFTSCSSSFQNSLCLNLICIFLKRVSLSPRALSPPITYNRDDLAKDISRFQALKKLRVKTNQRSRINPKVVAHHQPGLPLHPPLLARLC